MSLETTQYMICNCFSRRKCKAVWEDMTEINDGFNNEARFCEQCKKIVYLVETNNEIAIHIEFNDCIAIHDDIKQNYFRPRRIFM